VTNIPLVTVNYPERYLPHQTQSPNKTASTTLIRKWRKWPLLNSVVSPNWEYTIWHSHNFPSNYYRDNYINIHVLSSLSISTGLLC